MKTRSYKALLIVALIALCAVTYFDITSTSKHVGTLQKYLRAEKARTQLLQMVVNVTKDYQANVPITRDIARYYPDDDLDTSVYSYSYKAEHLAVIATAKDTCLVPAGKEKIAYFISTGRPVIYQYGWL